MITEASSELVAETRLARTPAGDPAELLILHNGKTIALSIGSLAMYRAPEFFGDPLGNGLIDSTALPEDIRLQVDESSGRLVESIQSGCVNLIGGAVLLILPNELRLFPDRQSALKGDTPLASLSLGE